MPVAFRIREAGLIEPPLKLEKTYKGVAVRRSATQKVEKVSFEPYNER